MAGQDRILYRDIRTVKAGGYERFHIHYIPEQFPTSSLWLKVKNTQSIALRAAYLTGPYVLYVDCRNSDYNPNEKCFITADQPVFEPQLLPGQSFYAELSCHTMKPSHQWTVDVVSQIIFNTAISIDFEITLGSSKEVLKEEGPKIGRKVGHFVPNTVLRVHNNDWLDLWNLPLPDPTRPIHLVVLTHGLHSTASADLMYIKEQIDAVGKDDNLCVKAYFGNVGKTERGIKYLGSRVAEYIVDLLTTNSTFAPNKVAKISFIGHSLGGLVQTFAIAYLHVNFPWFFDQIEPINFITLASPLLGVANENPMYINLALQAGVVGKTGQDLGLKQVEYDGKPLLLLLPSGPTHQVLKRFVRRTVYANAVNDGIVPLRTSALLYLDYSELTELYRNSDNDANAVSGADGDEVAEETGVNGGDIAKVPEESGFSMQGVFSYFMPQKSAPVTDPTKEQVKNQSGAEIEGIPTMSMIESFPNVLMPPLPSMRYINDPEARDNPILHDKIYDEADLPAPRERQPQLEEPSQHKLVNTARTQVKKILDKVDFDLDDVEEAIARAYHRNMAWRKVIVSLKPDAHNNIAVRRRFSNAYGWPVIDHLVKEHFGADIVDQQASPMLPADSVDMSDLTTILSRDVIARENEEIDRVSLASDDDIDHHQWINANDGESFFAVGPSGLLTDVSAYVGSLKDQWIKDKSAAAEDSTSSPPPDQTPAVMGSFT
ncbi:putative lipase YDL109C [Diutina catenulata]